MAALTLHQIDAFTSRPFAGNPAAVCLLEGPADEDWMQAVAAEMNLSETAFLEPRGEGFHIRWFTPSTEVPLCGHATLAAAHFLWDTGRLAPDAEARFTYVDGELSARRTGDGIAMRFPADPPRPGTAPPGLSEALRADPEAVCHGRFDCLVRLTDEAAVRAVRPDFRALKEIPTRGVMVTAAADDPACDFVCRFFAPGAGIDEDPVTGSAYCTLGPYWSAELGRKRLRAFQASARGGEVSVSVEDDAVVIEGQAVTVMRATLEDGR